MNIRHLPHLNDRKAWLAFFQREVSYCFTEQPEALVDFQSTYLLITVLGNQTSNGKQAVKYSIGAKSSIEPAWNFIKACEFNLQRMIDGLNQVDFNGNVRDNSLLKAHRDLTVRKFFSKERTVISPSRVGVLMPLTEEPEFWDLHHCCRVFANDQFSDLRTEQLALPNTHEFMVEFKGIPTPSGESILIALIDHPEQWQAALHPNDSHRIILSRNNTPLYSFSVDYAAPQPRLTKRVPRWSVLGD